MFCLVICLILLLPLVKASNYTRSLTASSWTQAVFSSEWSVRQYHSSVVYDSKLYVLGGTYGSSNFDDIYS